MLARTGTVPCPARCRGTPESNHGDVMAETTTDHETIRKWAEKHGGKPAAVRRTHQGGDVGIIRIMFPNAPQSEHDELVEITWDEFFEEFDKRKLALLYDREQHVQQNRRQRHRRAARARRSQRSSPLGTCCGSVRVP